MHQHHLANKAHVENVRALAAAAGISEALAEQRLSCEVLLTHDLDSCSYQFLASEIEIVLGRTLRIVRELTPDCTVELVLGTQVPKSGLAKIYVYLDGSQLLVDDRPSKRRIKGQPIIHPIWTLISACYVASAATFLAVGKGIANAPPSSFKVESATFYPSSLFDGQPVFDIGKAYLAGAGAIGNGFLWAAQYVEIAGELCIVDDDTVSEANLQRQIWFCPEDINSPKAEVLVAKAQPRFRHCHLSSTVGLLQQHPAKELEGNRWLSRLFVAVDSRRARRSLQSELPQEVFDASTTGSKEIVFHYNRQPNDLACLGCVYPVDSQEFLLDRAIASHLGIAESDLQLPRIDEACAKKILQKHPELEGAPLVGLAFDSLYKQLCGAGQLKSESGEDIIAPLAFVSVLAGTVLLVEFLKRSVYGREVKENEWRVNPWMPPVPEARRKRSRAPGCSCCGSEAVRTYLKDLWGE